MDFLLREIVKSDIHECMAMLTDRMLYDETTLTALAAMWTHIIERQSGAAALICDARPPGRIAHFAVLVFVSDARADEYHSMANPRIGLRMAQEFVAGGQPFLERDEIGQANAADGLNLVVTHHGYEERHGRDRERLLAATYESTRRHVFGWNLRTYTNEVFAADPVRDGKEMGQALGFDVRQYAAAALKNASIPHDKGPWVWLATREDAAKAPAGLTQALLFSSFSPPRFGLSSDEQRILALALDGRTDEAIAASTDTSLSTVKKRFRIIYDKVQDAGSDGDPFQISPPSNGLRGGENRRHLLNYLREHPEELRPYLPKP